MINNTENQEFDRSTSEANVPFDEAKASRTMDQVKSKIPVGKLKEYGKKAYAPLVQVLHKYQGEITPYISALSKGLQGGVDALSTEASSEADRIVAGWFREASEGLSEARTKLESSDINEIVRFIEVQAKNRPSLMFTSSYLSGLFFGRIGRHIGKKSFNRSSSSDQTSYEPPAFEGSSFQDSTLNDGDQPLAH